MKNQFLFSFAIFLLVLLNGCNNSSLDSNNATLTPIDSKILFDVSESYDNYNVGTPPRLYLTLSTEKAYGCSNFSIVTSVQINNNNLFVRLSGVSEPNICLTALGPATSRTKIDLADGDYSLQIIYPGFKDKYSLTISDSNVLINGDSTANTKPRNRIILRYPKNSFAYLCGTLLSDSSIYNNFLDTLRSKINIVEFHFPLEGKIPYPTALGGSYYDPPARYFYYKTESDFDQAADILKQYKDKYLNGKDGYGISLINWLGKQINSWML
ncbi:MAG: hypothetical protein ACYCVH_11890 [Ignavibacteriaceae bacterium]